MRPVAPAAAPPERFQPPRVAKPITARPAWVFMAIVAGIALACALGLHAAAYWASPMPLLSTLVLALLVTIVGSFGTFETVDDLSEYASLAMPIEFAMLLVLDWRHYVAGLAVGEVLTFVVEVVRRANPTQWYIRVFNVCIVVVAGAAAEAVLAAFGTLASAAPWASPVPLVALGLAALVWKLGDSVLTATLITLGSGRSLAEVRVPVRPFAAHFALFVVGIPFALVWHAAAWLAVFAIAPLGVGMRLLGVAELEHRVRMDARTGLTNAGAFDDALVATLDAARRDGRPVALLYLDLDRFKAVNDTHGHLAGDAVIAQIGGVLGAVSRRHDVAARTGGEEFAILVHDCEREGGVVFAERVRARIAARPFVIAGLKEPLAITASFGVAVFPDDGATPHALLAAADRALYAAKRDGRNCVRLASDAVARVKAAPER